MVDDAAEAADDDVADAETAGRDEAGAAWAVCAVGTETAAAAANATDRAPRRRWGGRERAMEHLSVAVERMSGVRRTHCP